MFIKIISINTYGESVISEAGNGAVIQLVPEPPINLQNYPTEDSDVTIRFTWDEGLNNGGTIVIDYAVYSDQASGDWILLDNAVTPQQFETSDVTSGLVYTFKLTSRNTVGSSDYSEEIQILAAKKPDAPLNFLNVPGITTAYQIGLDWTEGVYNGASPVIDFEIHYADQSGVYSSYRNGIVASDIIVINLIPGITYTFYVRSRNIIGFSDKSSIISIKAAQVADAPSDLKNMPAVTLANQIGLQWTAPVFDGGQ